MKKANTIALVQIISALLIVNYHTSILAIPVLNHIAKFGFNFNTVFVFLSGYLLSQSVALPATSSPTFRAFIYKRINRIYPSFHIALIVIALIYLSTGREFTINSLILAATGFSYYFNDNTFGIHLWFVSVILVCYLLFIPTYHGLRRHPVAFFMLILGIAGLTAFTREGSFYEIYNKVSGDIIYRFFYHYIVFSLAIYIGIKGDENSYPGKLWIGLFIVAFSLYIWLQPNPYFGVIAIGISILLAICTIQVIVMVSPFIERHLSCVFFLSSVTYQLYLIHYSVIDALNGRYHGKYIGYPLTFLFSIALAFVVLMLSKPYERLTRRCTGWLLRYAP